MTDVEQLVAQWPFHAQRLYLAATRHFDLTSPTVAERHGDMILRINATCAFWQGGFLRGPFGRTYSHAALDGINRMSFENKRRWALALQPQARRAMQREPCTHFQIGS